jgi:hypothetical protein
MPSSDRPNFLEFGEAAGAGYPRSRIVLPGLLLISVAVLGITPITDADVWWHLKFGEMFVQRRGFPAHDPFVFTAGDAPWIIRAWLAEVIFSLLSRAGGLDALIIFKAALFTFTVGLMWSLGAALRCPQPAAAALLVLGAFVVRPRVVERPELFSFPLLAWYLFVLMGRRGGRSPYLLIPAHILWANLSSSFFLGLLLPWPFIADAWALRRRAAGREPHAEMRPSLRHTVRAALLLFPASALTPQGLRVFVWPFVLPRMPTISQLEEFQKLPVAMSLCTWCLEEGIAFVVLSLAALAVCLVRMKRGGAVGPGSWALVLGSGAVPFVLYYRLLPYCALILAAVAMQGIGALSQAQPEDPGRRSDLLARPAATASLAVFLLAFLTYMLLREGRLPFGLGVTPNLFPEGAARFIQTADARGPLFNDLAFGGYLLWSLFPRHRVFIHSDYWHSASDDQLIARLFRSEQDPATFGALMAQYQIELIVIPNKEAAWQFLAADPRWALLYWDQVASVYARRGGANAALIAAAELRLTRYAPDLSYLLPVAQDPTRFPAAAAELRRLVAEDPANRAARLSLAFLLKAAGQALPEALAQVEAVQRQGLQHATLLTWRAELLARLGRPAEAEAAARAALRLTPTARAARLVLADLRAQAGDRAEAIGLLRALLALPDLAPDQRREAAGRLDALEPSR